MLSARRASGLRPCSRRPWTRAATRSWHITRALGGGCCQPEHVDQLWSLLDTTDGGEILPGLRVDTDLRWSLLHRLVIIGAAGEDHIAAELGRDDTATGRRQTAYALAARPTEQAKADAWAQTIESDELPIRSCGQRPKASTNPKSELIRPYLGRYLDAVPKPWAQRTTDSARSIIVRMFPRLLADAEIAERIRGWLEETDLSPAPRRLIVEGLADMDRALRAQARDRTAGQAARRR